MVGDSRAEFARRLPYEGEFLASATTEDGDHVPAGFADGVDLRRVEDVCPAVWLPSQAGSL